MVTSAASPANTAEAVDSLIEAVRAELVSLIVQSHIATIGVGDKQQDPDHDSTSGDLPPDLAARLETVRVRFEKEFEYARAESATRARAAAVLIGGALGEVEAIARLSPVAPGYGTPAARLGAPWPNAPAAGLPPARRGLRRFLHVDIVLPMVAVLITLIILVAWIG